MSNAENEEMMNIQWIFISVHCHKLVYSRENSTNLSIPEENISNYFKLINPIQKFNIISKMNFLIKIKSHHASVSKAVINESVYRVLYI